MKTADFVIIERGVLMMNVISGTLEAIQSIAVDANASLANGHEYEMHNTIRLAGKPACMELYVALR